MVMVNSYSLIRRCFLWLLYFFSSTICQSDVRAIGCSCDHNINACNMFPGYIIAYFIWNGLQVDFVESNAIGSDMEYINNNKRYI